MMRRVRIALARINEIRLEACQEGVHRGKTTITVRSGKKSVKVKVTVK